MRSQAERIGTATLTRFAEVVHAGLGEMRGATAPRLLLEVVCARLLLPSASDTESALLQRVERIETRLDMSIPAGEPAVGSGQGVLEQISLGRLVLAFDPCHLELEPLALDSIRSLHE